jgi:hypothetical protein
MQGESRPRLPHAMQVHAPKRLAHSDRGATLRRKVEQMLQHFLPTNTMTHQFEPLKNDLILRTARGTLRPLVPRLNISDRMDR